LPEIIETGQFRCFIIYFLEFNDKALNYYVLSKKRSGESDLVAFSSAGKKGPERRFFFTLKIVKSTACSLYLSSLKAEGYKLMAGLEKISKKIPCVLLKNRWY